jgi:hypothetical protein
MDFITCMLFQWVNTKHVGLNQNRYGYILSYQM